jgi:ferredoxin
MTDVYQALARHLDKLPAGYPATESGVELRILKRLFTEQEALIAQGLTMLPEAPEAIAERLQLAVGELADTLADMSRKGLIFRISKGGSHLYSAAQFVIGIWEYHLNDLDEALIRDVNEYLPHVMKESWNQTKTKQLRVIPISEKLNAEMNITSYEMAEEIIRGQSKIVVSPCICRKEHQMAGKGCDNPLEVCLSFGTGAYYYEQNGLGRGIDQQEALEVLEKGREAGLVLQPGNSKKPTNICMCCGCCCQVLKNLKDFENPAHAVHTNYYAQVDADECVACEDCVERCHMDAIVVAETARVLENRCIGCGTCITACPTGALQFHQKEAADRYEPPQHVFETYMNMARERGLV